MPLLISRATGNFTAAATWGVADSATGSQLTAPTASTTTTTSYVYSSTFTGTNTKVADGVALLLRRVNTTGTFSVALSDDNGTTVTREVTVNATDLSADQSWVFFKFASTLTLDGGTDYRVGVRSSINGNVSVLRDGTAGNWARIISTTDTAAPAAGDTMLIVGEFTGAGASTSYTVTMNNTATTDFGNGTATATAPSQTNPQNFNGIQIGNKGTLTWGTAAATAYYLKLSGNLIVWDGGTYNMGTSGTPCPRDSSMYLQFDCAAAGDFGACFMGGSTVNIYGQSRTSGKNVWFCKLTADAAANATSLTVSADTGWLDNDEIAIASTTRTATQCEAGALNGAAGASTVTVDSFAGTAGGLAFAHSGTSPTQAEVILLTRNVRISGASSTLTSYCLFLSLSVCTLRWAEFFWLGSNTNNKWPISIAGSSSGTTIDMQYCCLRDTLSGGVNQTNGIINIDFTISNNAFWRLNTGNTVSVVNFSKSSGSGLALFTDNIVMYPIGVATTFALITNARNVYAGATATTAIGSSTPLGTFEDNVFHSCGGGFTVERSTSVTPSTISNLTMWRCSGGLTLTSFGSAVPYLILNGGTFFGNSNQNIAISALSFYLILNNVSLNGDSSFSTTHGLAAQISGMGGFVEMNNCSFGVASGILVAHSTSDINFTGYVSSPQMLLNNTILASAIEVNGATSGNMSILAFVKSSKHDQTEGLFRSWFFNRRIESDSTIFNTAAPSERITPLLSTSKAISGPRLVAVNDGSTITINAYVRKSAAGDGAAYNGNQPRLIVKANPACGINSDTVLDTMTVGTGTWEQLTGTTAAVNADGALEFVVDCDGTAGWVNVDDWTVT